MTARNVARGLIGAALLSISTVVMAAPMTTVTVAGKAAEIHAIDYRPYYHCHGPKRCHGKGNYYKYTPSDEPIVNRCQYGRGCGYNTGWNSPSARFDYTGRRWGKHRHRRR